MKGWESVVHSEYLLRMTTMEVLFIWNIYSLFLGFVILNPCFLLLYFPLEKQGEGSFNAHRNISDRHFNSTRRFI